MSFSHNPRGAAHVANNEKQVASFVGLFAHHNSRNLIRNLTTEMGQITLGPTVFPYSINHGDQSGNCYICRPSTAFIDYAIAETRNFAAQPWLRACTTVLIRCCAPMVRATGLDHQVQLNNWLLSTNPVPTLTTAMVSQAVADLTKRFPQHAIVIRSLNPVADSASLAALKAGGFQLLAARRVYIFSPAEHARKTPRDMLRDQKMLARNALRPVSNDEFVAADFNRCEELYNMLYLQKYTPLNPQYTATYLAEMHRHGLLHLMGLRNPDGQLALVTGLFENGTTLTQPLVGYDISVDQSVGLYRMAMALAQKYAIAHQLFFNMSAGAGAFKRNRGARPTIEYMAVYNQHLSLRKRLMTTVLRTLLKTIGIPLLERFEL